MAMPDHRTQSGPEKHERHPTTGEQRISAITRRSLMVGAVGAIVVGLLAPYSRYGLDGSHLELDFSTPLSLFLLFALVAVPNLLMRRLSPRLALQPAELVAVYGMMLIASAVVTMGLSSQLPSILTGPAYYASPENRFAEQVLPHMPAWLLPRNTAPGTPLVRYLFEGLPAGMTIPWADWLPAVAAWAPLLLALYAAMVAITVLLRRQWVENERLAYPLTFLPLELIGARTEGKPQLLGRPLFWVGFALPFFTSVLTGLHHYFPSVPSPNLAQNVEVVRGVWSLIFRVSFPMLGFFYLVNLDVTFSLWLFNLLTQAFNAALAFLQLEVRANVGPYGAVTDLFKFVGTGAFLALFATSLWVGRRHLSYIWRRVAGAPPVSSEQDEVMPYPTAFWTLVVSVVVMALWLHASGLPALVIPVFLLLAFTFFLGLTRIVVEAGMANAVAPSIAPGMTASLLGTPVLGPQGMIALAMTYMWCADIRTFVMTSSAHTLRMTTVVREGQSRLLGGFAIALVLAFVASMWVTLTYAYRTGGANVESWFFGATGVPTTGYHWAASRVMENAGPSLAGWLLTGAGALVYAALAAGRFRFVNWPLHPIGFTLGSTWIMNQLWFSAFLSWLIKSVMLRYGGLSIYTGARPAFLGMIIGQYAIVVLWLIVDTISGKRGVRLFWI